MDHPTKLANDLIGDGRVCPPTIVMYKNADVGQSDLTKDTISVDQTRSSILSYGAPLGSVDTPPDSIRDKLAIDSYHEPTDDYAPSASLQVHAGKDEESSLSEVDSAAAIRHKPWISGHARAEEHDVKAAPAQPTSRRLSDSEEKVQAWLESTEEPDPQSIGQDDDLGSQQRQRRKSTIQTLKSHLLHGRVGTGIGKWMGKMDTSYHASHGVQDGKQELDVLDNSKTDTRGLAQ